MLGAGFGAPNGHRLSDEGLRQFENGGESWNKLDASAQALLMIYAMHMTSEERGKLSEDEGLLLMGLLADLTPHERDVMRVSLAESLRAGLSYEARLQAAQDAIREQCSDA